MKVRTLSHAARFYSQAIAHTQLCLGLDVGSVVRGPVMYMEHFPKVRKLVPRKALKLVEGISVFLRAWLKYVVGQDLDCRKALGTATGQGQRLTRPRRYDLGLVSTLCWPYLNCGVLDDNCQLLGVSNA